MATLDSLAGDQRAVLQLVLARGRGYAEIGRLLSISPASVRERALAALDALGPPTDLDPEVRQTVCDYLLRQLDGDESGHAHDLLELSAAARTWARAVAAELAPLAAEPLPAIPEDPVEPAPALGPQPAADAAPGPDEPAPRPETPAPVVSTPTPDAPSAPDAPAATPDTESGPPSSRRGGMVVIGVAVLIVIVAVVLVLVLGGHHSSHPTVASNPTPTTSSSTSTSSTTSSAHPIAQVNLFPTTKGSKAVAAAEVVQQGSLRAIAIVGQHIPANSKHNSYEVWLYSSPKQFEKLGFVSPAVGRSGRFSDETELPSDAGRFKDLIVTTETTSKPTAPGPILLRGTLSGLS